MKKLPLVLILLCVSCTPALIAVSVTVGAAGGYVTAQVTHDNRPLDAGSKDSQ